jgi:hypothetical protein
MTGFKEHPKTDPHTLARVRKNQQNHRARRREYIASLEQKVKSTQDLLSQAEAEIERLQAQLQKCSCTHVESREDCGVAAATGGEIAPDSLRKDAASTLILTINGNNMRNAAVGSSINQSRNNLVFENQGSSGDCCEPPAYAHFPHATAGESTTPCGEAFVLIDQQNSRALEFSMLYSWLYEGFRKPSKNGEDCRVENSRLLALMDYISSS